MFYKEPISRPAWCHDGGVAATFVHHYQVPWITIITMRYTHFLPAAGALIGAANGQSPGITYTATVSGIDSNTSILGNYYN
jgi:hypothetical protein